MLRIPGFWDAATCARVRDAMDRGMASPAEVVAGDPGVRDGSTGAYVIDQDGRRATDIEVDQGTCEFAEREMSSLCERLSREFDSLVNDIEGPAFLRYVVGDMYGRHRDTGEPAGRRIISVTLFLNSGEARTAGGFAGGALRLYDELTGAPTDVVAETGTLVAFPSAAVHEVLPVTAGARDAMVTWFLAPASRERRR